MTDSQVKATVLIEADKGKAQETRRLLSSVSTDLKNLDKGNPLKNVQASFQQLPKQINTTATSTSHLQKELTKIARAEQLRQVSIEMGNLARKTQDTDKAVIELEKRLKALGASQDEIQGLAGTFNAAQQGQLGGNRLARLGSELRSLPSTQIPGLGIGTDAIGNILRLGGALGNVTEKISLITTVTTALTPVLGAGAASVTAVAVAAAPFVIALGAIALAIKSLTDQAAREAEGINSIVDAQRDVGQQIARGLNTQDAQQQLEELQRLRQEELDRVAQLNQQYKENVESQGALTGVIKLTSGAEDALVGQIDKGRTIVTDYETKIAALTRAMSNGSLATNDAVAAEEARKEAEAQQLQDQNADRERAAREAEQSAEKIKQAQDRITTSNRQFGEKLEDNARAASERLADIEIGYQDKRKDIQTKYSDDLIKIALDARRKEIDAARNAARKESDAIIKARQDEQDAVVNHQRTLEDIRNSALNSERDFLQERNFLQAALASQSAQDQIDEANLAAQREAQDRAIQQQREAEQRSIENQREAEDRYIVLTRARQDRLNAYNLENRDAKINHQRSLRDAQTNNERQHQQTLIAYNREQEQLQSHLNEMIGIRGAAYQAERAIAQGASAEQVLRSVSGGNTSNNSTVINDNRSNTFTGSFGGMVPLEQMIQRTVLNTMRQVRYR